MDQNNQLILNKYKERPDRLKYRHLGHLLYTYKTYKKYQQEYTNMS